MSNIPPIQPDPGFSNYPRSGAPVPGGGYQRPPGVYYESIGEAWRMIQANVGGWVVLSLCFLAIQYAVSIPLSFVSNLVAYGSMFGPGYGAQADISKILISFAISSLSYLIILPLQTGFQITALKAVRGWAVGPGDLWVAFPKLGQVLIGNLVYGILFLGGCLLFIIPAFYVIGVLAFVQMLIVDRNMTGMQAVEESYRALKKHGWSMFGLLFVAGLCSALGALACCIGVIFTLPIALIAQAIIYNYFYPPIDQNPQGYAIGVEPPRSWQ